MWNAEPSLKRLAVVGKLTSFGHEKGVLLGAVGGDEPPAEWPGGVASNSELTERMLGRSQPSFKVP